MADGLPFPTLLAGYAHVHEWFDEAAGRFEVDVRVLNPVFGRIFGYHGSFTLEEEPCTEIPTDCRPIREERRE